LKITKEYVNQHISRNVRYETNPITWFVPLIFKKFFARLAHHKFSGRRFSGKISNLGIVTLPKEIEDKVDEFHFVLNPSSDINTGLGIISYKDNLYMNFGRTFMETNIEDFIFEKLVRMGVSVKFL